jgi:hypothetical protein
MGCELGTKLEAFRLFLGDELEKVRVPWNVHNE